MKRFMVLKNQIDESKYYKCTRLSLDDEQYEAILVGDKLTNKIVSMLQEIQDYTGEYDYLATFDCYIEKTEVSKPGVYTSSSKFFKDFPDIFERYCDAIDQEL